MKRRGPGGLLVAATVCSLCLAMAVTAGAERIQYLLSWDDGSMDSWDHVVTGQVGMRMAVMFQAPEWAEWITEIHFYIADDQVDDPSNPELPTTRPFSAYVWRPSGGEPNLPGPAAIGGVNSGELYLEDEWLEVVLPEAVYVADPSEFPDRVFFAGMEWLSRNNPYIGEDHSDPLDYMSFRFNWAAWEVRIEADTMIRVVVSDTWTNPTESGSWSQIKALFR